MASFPVTRAGAILAVSDFAASLAFYRDRLGLEVEAVYDDPPYATLVVRRRAHLARRAGPSGGGPARRRDGRPRRSLARRRSCSCSRSPTRCAVHALARGRGRRDSSRRPSARRGAAAASSASTRTATSSRSSSPHEGRRPAGAGDVGVDDGAGSGDPRARRRDRRRSRATAICGADLFPFHGLTPGFENGTVLGHEFAGSVVEVGAGRAARARRAARRQHEHDLGRHLPVTAAPGRVTQCQGRSLFGYSGVYPRLDGGQAELVRVPSRRPLPARARRRDLRRGRRLPRRHPADGLRRGRARRRRGGRHGRRRRLRAGRADGGALRGRRRRPRDRSRRHRRAARARRAARRARPSSRPPRAPIVAEPRPAGSAPTS